MRKLSLVIAGILGAGSPLIGQAATLGQAQVQSYLSEPLEARVPLMRTSDEPLDEITVQLAPASFYRDAGVPLSNLTGNLTFTIESDGGQEYVRIGSNRPIRDPILSFLLQIESPQGRMIRSYNLLLDPPSAATAAEPSAAPDTASGTVASLTSAAAPDWQRVAPASDIELDATRKVELGDTLSGIARDYVREGDDLRAVMQAIIDANPQAFANGNGNAMMAGATLNVPSPTSDSNASAAREPTQGATDQASAQAPALELLTPTEEGANGNTDREADQEVSEGIAPLTRTNPLPAIGDAAPATGAQTEREAALTQEELESARAENQALTGQLESLKKEVESVKVAVETRDTTIAELKETVAQARQEAEQAEALRNSFWLQWGKFLVG
ncbi:MAG TPA: hypothetical protein ENO19_07680, partial [Halothiobacillaceae bacterium]|nr:hypothetical protein [Halothiobacillaceae bacterium]